MSDYNDGEVENVSGSNYCMKKSWQARNNADMNKAMGYSNLSDQANTAKAPTPVKMEKRNSQLSPSMPGENKYDYNKNR